MQILFGEEITQQHIAIFNSLKRLMGKWRARAAQRKNIIAVEHFANDDIQKRAIIKHKEQAIINVSFTFNLSVRYIFSRGYSFDFFLIFAHLWWFRGFLG